MNDKFVRTNAEWEKITSDDLSRELQREFDPMLTLDGNEWNDHSDPFEWDDHFTPDVSLTELLGWGEKVYLRMTEERKLDFYGFNWVHMNDLQTPVLCADRPLRHPRMFVGDKTLRQATKLINAKWNLMDEGFVLVDDVPVWKWWD